MIEEILRREIAVFPGGIYEISRTSGVAKSTLFALMRGHSVSIKTADKLFRALGIKFVIKYVEELKVCEYGETEVLPAKKIWESSLGRWLMDIKYR